MSDVIKEFLVGLGFKVNDGQYKKFDAAIARSTKAALDLGKGAAAAASVVAASVVEISERYEDLYYAAIRTGTSVPALKAFEYGSRAIGISAEQAAGSLERFNVELARNPGKVNFLQAMGIQTAGRSMDQMFNDLIGKLRNYPKHMQFPVGALFGLSSSDILVQTELLDRRLRKEAERRQIAKEAGVDEEALKLSSQKLNDELHKLSLQWELLSVQAAEKFIPAVTQGAQLLAAFGGFAVNAGRATDGFTTSVAALVGTLASLKGLGWLLSLLGLSKAGAAASAAGGLGLGVGAGTLATVGGGVAIAGGLAVATMEAAKTPEGKAFKATGDFWTDLYGYGRALRPTLQRWFGVDSPGGSGGASLGGGSLGQHASHKTIMDYFIGKGWSREAAAGIAANLHAESGYRANLPGDGGRAYGVAQWHPDRQRNFAKVFGKDIRQSTLEEQLAFVDWELNNTESFAGAKLRGARSAAEAGFFASALYERPAAGYAAGRLRGGLASQIDAGYSGATINVTNNIHVATPEEGKRSIWDSADQAIAMSKNASMGR